MRWNDRKTARVQFEHKHLVNLMGVDRTWRQTLTLLDASESRRQARGRTLPTPPRQKKTFSWFYPPPMAFRRCELVWVNGPHVGVRFITEKTNKKNTRARMIIPLVRNNLAGPEPWMTSDLKCSWSLRERSPSSMSPLSQLLRPKKRFFMTRERASSSISRAERCRQPPKSESCS